MIPFKANRTAPGRLNKKAYRERNRIERLLGKLKEFRRVATRYEKLKRTFLGIIHLALGFIRLKRLLIVNRASPEIRFMVYVPDQQLGGFDVDFVRVVGGDQVDQAVPQVQAFLTREYFLTNSYPITSRRGVQGGLNYHELFYQIPSSAYGNRPLDGWYVAAPSTSSPTAGCSS